MRLINQAWVDWVAAGIDHDKPMLIMEDAHRDGSFVALLAALLDCAESPYPAPYWVLMSASEHIIDLVYGNGGRVAGRAGNIVARLRQDHIHSIRDEEVGIILEKREELKEEVEDLSSTNGRTVENRRSIKERLQERTAYLAAIGRGRDGAFRTASRLLGSRQGYAGTKGAMKHSYELVRGSPRRFWILPPRLMHFLQLGDISGHVYGNSNFEQNLLGDRYRKRVAARRYQWTDLPPAGDDTNAMNFPRPSPVVSAQEALEQKSPGPSSSDQDSPFLAAVEAGSVLAVLDGLRIFALIGQKPPAVLLRQAFRIILSALHPDAMRQSRQRPLGLKASKSDLLHGIRREAVLFGLFVGPMLARPHPAIARRLGAERLAFARAGTGRGVKGACRVGAHLLEGTPWSGTAADLEKSWRLTSCNEDLRRRFWIPRNDLRLKLLIPGLWTEETEKKYTEILARTADFDSLILWLVSQGRSQRGHQDVRTETAQTAQQGSR